MNMMLGLVRGRNTMDLCLEKSFERSFRMGNESLLVWVGLAWVELAWVWDRIGYEWDEMR